MALNIVLLEPEIPQNTGNISRTCALTGTKLHLVRPLGFSVDDKHLKRAGLDYWKFLNIRYYDNLTQFFQQNKDGNFFYVTTKAVNTYSDIQYTDNDFFIYGKETAGLDEKLLKNNAEKCIRIPMIEGARSLNLSNSVAIVVYEALRQKNFQSLKTTGSLTKYEW